MPKILHFADAHIDMANFGKHDPVSGLPMRVIDFLKSLDTIIDTAIQERVDLVLFAGDAYKDRTPSPTYQREWGRRIMRLSHAGIPTLMLVGNHDLSPSLGRASAIHEFETLEIPHIHLIGKPCFLTPDQLEGLPLQILALPWISRSGLMASLNLSATDPAQIYAEIEARLSDLVQGWLESADASLPTVLTAHCSVQGAVYGTERAIMLGADLVLPGALVKDPRLDYVALGHIHKSQDLNSGAHPPVIYPGSIERVDFGEVNDDKFFVIAHVERGQTRVEWRRLDGIRRFIDRHVRLTEPEAINEHLMAALPPAEDLADAIVRLVVEYPRDWEMQIDEASLRRHLSAAFEFHLVKRPQMDVRIRINQDRTISSLTPLELLDIYWRASHTDPDEAASLAKLAQEVISGSDQG